MNIHARAGAVASVPTVGGTLVLSWISYHGRSDSLARAIDGEAVFIAAGRTGNLRTAIFRHLVSSCRTFLLCLRRRPKNIVVMAPPLTLVVVAFVMARLIRARFVIDAHSGVFESRRWSWGLPVFFWIARRSNATLVTNRDHLERLETAKAPAIQLHDSPLGTDSGFFDAAAPDDAGEYVIVPSGFASDEPLTEIVAAAEQLPEVRFVITGQYRGGPGGSLVPQAMPANVRLTGFVPNEEYRTLLRGAAVVLGLTTRERTMQRAGYEALMAHRPLVTSSTNVLHEYFAEGALFADPDAGSIATALREALARQEELTEGMRELHADHVATWTRQVNALRELLA